MAPDANLLLPYPIGTRLWITKPNANGGIEKEIAETYRAHDGGVHNFFQLMTCPWFTALPVVVTAQYMDGQIYSGSNCRYYHLEVDPARQAVEDLDIDPEQRTRRLKVEDSRWFADRWLLPDSQEFLWA